MKTENMNQVSEVLQQLGFKPHQRDDRDEVWFEFVRYGQLNRVTVDDDGNVCFYKLNEDKFLIWKITDVDCDSVPLHIIKSIVEGMLK